MSWEDIIGHEENISVLRRLAATDRIPHAFLLTGSKGIGKGMVAKTLAATILCQSHDEKPCGECLTCRKLAAGTHPDVICFDSNGQTLKIEQMRELQTAASLSPAMGGKRIVIIEDAERLTAPAANSLLKILEEPSSSLMFILTASSTHSLLNTIVSRCRLMRLAPVAADSLATALAQRGYPVASARIAARLSGGRIGRALALLEPQGLDARNKGLEVLRRIPEVNTLSGWNEILQLEGNSLELSELAEQLIFLLRDMLLIRNRCDGQIIFNEDLIADLTALAADWSTDGISKALNEAMDTARALTGNANLRLLIEALLLRMRQCYQAAI